MDIAFQVLAGVLLGGLVNALADNLPYGRLLSLPRYSDGTARPPVAWLGIGAFLCGLRRSPGDENGEKTIKLSWRYPLTEVALTALLLSIDLAAIAKPQVSLGQQLLRQLYVVIFVLLAVVDIEHKRILILPVVLASMLAIFDAMVYSQHPPGLSSSLAGGVVGGIAFSFVYAGGQVYGRIRKRERELPTAFGKGDVYLMAMGGFVVGFPNVVATITIAIFLGGAGALAIILRARALGQRYGRFKALPYGPYILAATYLVMLFPGLLSLSY